MPGLVALLAVLLLTTAVTADAAGAGTDSTRLSNERTLTQWAHPVHGRAPIRARPTSDARRIGNTHRLTEDGLPEVYLALRSWISPRGRTWLKVRNPTRSGGKGWLQASALGPLNQVRTQLVVDRKRKRATLYKSGRRIWGAPVGIGARNTPTPAGKFWIREKFRIRNAGGMYGPVAFGTSAYSVLSDWPGGGVIGIHGTNEPALIPGRPSHGCIRLRNSAAKALWHRMPVGTPVLIR